VRNRPRIASTRDVHVTPYCTLVARYVEGDPTPYYSLRLPDYVTVVAVTPASELILVTQYRPALDRVCLELPAGTVDPGEAPLESAQRELREETGYESATWTEIGCLMPDVGRLGNRLWCFHAGDARPATEPWRAEEGVECHLQGLAGFRGLLKEGAFDHALHVAAIHLAMAHGKLPTSILA
jgi:ADP-ribose pyrophosphatase